MHNKFKLTNKTAAVLFAVANFVFVAQVAFAKEVKVKFEVKETEVVIDNKGTQYSAWTYNGTIPGPVVRVTEGDVVDFELVNPESNQQSHSLDFHAAVVDVLNELEDVRPGHSKHFTFKAKYPGVFIYHCGAATMAQHIARGMFGVIIVDPKEGYSNDFPKPDREYVLVQSQYFPDAGDKDAMIENRDWTASLINGKIFHYDPVHDENATLTLQSEPGERVRIYFVNANINMPVALHPIAGIWDRVYVNGNPKNVLYGVQTHNIAVATGDMLDIVSPADRPTNNAIVDHTMSAAMRGAITLLMNAPGVDPTLGKGNKILLR